MKKQAYNPYLPSYEYIPDGEPYVFGDRVYIYGSHDFYNGYVFCMGDYVCWSAPIDDLGNWRYEGVIYPRNEDPLNKEGKMCLYAPDVTVGPDGRYYLYYVLDKVSIVSVAVCDTPAGRYEFYGYVHYEDGTRLGERVGDEPQFDPGVITEGGKTYLYTGFCGQGDASRTGARIQVLAEDMLTIIREPETIIPGSMYSAGTEFEGHAFFEAPSIRKRDDVYYFIYSSEVMHELCYATSKSPLGPFKYGGVIVSNMDIGIATGKPDISKARMAEHTNKAPGHEDLSVDAEKIAEALKDPAKVAIAYGANNHGSIVQIGKDWYIFYHRHTLNTWYSRQGCAEKLHFTAEGSIPQVEMTSCGLNGGPLEGKGEYPAYLACNLFMAGGAGYIGAPDAPRVMQDGKDGDEEVGYIGNVTDGATAGFKYFDLKGVKAIRITTRGYGNGTFEVRTALDGDVLARLTVDFSNVWETYEASFTPEDGVSAIYLTYTGGGNVMLKGFELV